VGVRGSSQSQSKAERVAGQTQGGAGLRGIELMRAMQAPIIEAMADGVCILSAADGKVLYADLKLNRMLGRAAGSLDGEKLSALHEIERDARDGSDTNLAERLHRYGEATVDVRMSRREGASLWCRVRAHAFDRPERAVWVLLYENITDLKKSDEVRKKEEARFRTLVGAGVVGVTTSDGEGRVLEANDYFLELVGYSRVELARDQVRWDDLTAPEYRAVSSRAVEEVRTTGRFGPFEKEYVRKDGKRIRVLVGGAALESGSTECVTFTVALNGRRT